MERESGKSVLAVWLDDDDDDLDESRIPEETCSQSNSSKKPPVKICVKNLQGVEYNDNKKTKI